MTAPLAFRATYEDWKLVKTRGVVQVIFEVPIAEHDVAYQMLGGMPNTAQPRWFGIAPLSPPSEKEIEKSTAAPAPVDPKPAGARDWRDVPPAAQSGIRCGEAAFRAFLHEVKGYMAEDKNQAELAVRAHCCVHSRVEFGTNHHKRVLWHQLDTEYQAWLARERVGA